MSNDTLSDSWKTEVLRQSVVEKLNAELQGYRLKQKNPGCDIEKAICEKAQIKRHYLGYASKIILNVRNMVCIQDEWLQNHVKTVLSKPPPKLRRVLPSEDFAKYSLEIMKLTCKEKAEEAKVQPKKY